MSYFAGIFISSAFDVNMTHFHIFIGFVHESIRTNSTIRLAIASPAKIINLNLNSVNYLINYLLMMHLRLDLQRNWEGFWHKST